MRNLKRVLTLVMAVAMMMSLLVVGAGAAFPDQNKIENTDAVNMNVALGIIKGRDTGDFDPTGNVTRAEMAKMICVLLNGGKEPTLGSKANASYKDIKGHWAEAYIEYCTSLGIVAGMGDGTFAPNANVTGTQAAKMLLVALGYDAAFEGFNGASWSVKINVAANQKALYTDLAIDPNAPLNRDNAAQMVWNALEAVMVKYTYSLTTVNGQLQNVQVREDNGVKTLLKDRYNTQPDVVGTVSEFSYDSKADKFTYKVNGETFKSANDYSNLYGMKAKVVYKDRNNIYGMFAKESAVIVSGIVGDLTINNDSIKIDGKTYDLDGTKGNTSVFNFAYNTAVTERAKLGALTSADPFAFDAIDNDDDGKIDTLRVYPFTVAKVTFVGKDSVTVGNVSYKFDDATIYNGIAKDDFAVVISKNNTVDGNDTLKMAEIVKGEITAVKGGTDYRVNGTWYTEANAVTATVGDTVEMAVVNGYIFNCDVVDATAMTETLYVAGVEGTVNTAIAPVMGMNRGVDTRVLLSDGTSAVVKSMRVDVTTETDGISKIDGDLVKLRPANGLYTYSINKDGVYELKAVKNANAAQIAATAYYAFAAANLPGDTTFATATAYYVKGSNASGSRLDGNFIADDAVIYLHNTDGGGKLKVVTGAELKTMGSYGTAGTYLMKSVNGLSTVKVAYLSAAVPFTNTDVSTGYGYVISTGYAEKNADKDWVVKFTVWDGSKNVDLTAVDSTLTSGSAANAQFKKGAFVSFTNSATAGEVTEVTNLRNAAIANGTEVAITGFDGGKNIAFDGNAVKMKDDNKTVVIYVDTANTKGIQGGSIELAQKLANGVYVKNAIAKVTSSEVDILFVDTANKLDAASYTITHATGAVVDANGIDVAAGAVVKVGATTIATGNAVTAGSAVDVTLAISGTATAATTVKMTVTLADATTIVRTVSIANGGVGANTTVSFTMPYQNVTGIAVTAE